MLLTRIISSAALAPLILLVVYAGGLWLVGLVALAGGLMAWEWARLCGAGQGAPERAGGVAAGGAVAVAVLGGAPLVFALATPGYAVAALLLGAVTAAAAERMSRPRAAPWLGLGSLYIGLACLALLWLRELPGQGRDLVFWLLAVVWATDIGAYFAGRGIGGPKLAPRISPNKTWAGLVGGALCAGLVGGALCAGLVGVAAAAFLGRNAMLLVVGGMALAVVAQGGDLLESWCKRRFGVKDSGHIIPGHGGILDRVDGLLAVLPVAFLYFWVVRESI